MQVKQAAPVVRIIRIGAQRGERSRSSPIWHNIANLGYNREMDRIFEILPEEAARARPAG